MHLRPYVVVVDDDQAMCRALVRLHSSNFDVAAFQRGRDALQSWSDREPDCIVIDIELPDFKALDLFTWIHQTHPHVPVVVITAWEDDELRPKAIANDATGFFYKPFSGDFFSADAPRLNCTTTRRISPAELSTFARRRRPVELSRNDSVERRPRTPRSIPSSPAST